MPNFGEHPAAEVPKANDVPKKPVTFQEDLEEAQRTLGKSLAEGMDANDEAMEKQWADMDAHYGASPASTASEDLKNPTESVTTGESASLEVSYAVSKFEAFGLSKDEAMTIGKVIQDAFTNGSRIFGEGTGPGTTIQIIGVRRVGIAHENEFTILVKSGTVESPDQATCDVGIVFDDSLGWIISPGITRY